MPEYNFCYKGKKIHTNSSVSTYNLNHKQIEENFGKPVLLSGATFNDVNTNVVRFYGTFTYYSNGYVRYNTESYVWKLKSKLNNYKLKEVRRVSSK